MGLLSNERAQQGMARTAVMLVVGLLVAAVIGAVMIPVAIDSIEGDETNTLAQDTGTVYDVNGELTSTVTDTTAGTSATVELNDTRTAGTTSNTVSVDSTTTYAMDGGDVNVTVDEANAGNATVSYAYDRDYAYSDGAQSLWGILGLAIVLALVLFLLREAMDHV